MNIPEAYAKEIKSIRQERKRLNTKSRNLLSQQRKAEEHLYNYMVRYGLDKYDDITLKSITPKKKISRKKKAEKKQDAIELFRKTGIPDPETFWEQLQETQSSSTTQNLDPILGL